ncbi:hypothetical protein GUJ93_ZPchr0006g43344 [Zizania palustris]|uniref:Uncharacterized protein n=1 Tax=Zizania palustris TaxID=103762 RepID=A0A8J5VVI1_ZIZPA|nr:hypothetical protein GUJ93_ZPchr0006g43344 [Zizania palustris]
MAPPPRLPLSLLASPLVSHATRACPHMLANRHRLFYLMRVAGYSAGGEAVEAWGSRAQEARGADVWGSWRHRCSSALRREARRRGRVGGEVVVRAGER